MGGESETGRISAAEVRIGTNGDSTFAITNVPTGVEWYVYGKMESLAARGQAPVVECATKRDGEEIDLGDPSITPASSKHPKLKSA